MTQRWPDTFSIVRHGQSAGNVARDAAYAAGHSVIDILERDVDVPLSAVGEAQSEALGHWFARIPTDSRPTVVLVSPYLRARHTASIIQAAGGFDPSRPIIVDERLREKEFGILDRLTRSGIDQRFPEQAEMRTRVGKFYYRPPGGESWCDVILRLRSVLDTVNLHYCGRGARVLIVAHQVIVLCFRYLLEGLNEEQILAIDREGDVANCGVTTYTFNPSFGAHGAMQLRAYNFIAPLEEAGAPVTTEPDVAVAPR
jgi:broad specificity phosphatase PhoE